MTQGRVGFRKTKKEAKKLRNKYTKTHGSTYCNKSKGGYIVYAYNKGATKWRKYSVHRSKASAEKMLKILKNKTTLKVKTSRIIKNGKMYELWIGR